MMIIVVVAVVEEVLREIIHCYQHFIYLDMIYLSFLLYSLKFTFIDYFASSLL